MNTSIYLLIAALFVLSLMGMIAANKAKRKTEERNSIISWYNHLIDQYTSIYKNVAEQYNKKYETAEKFGDDKNIKKLNSLYDSINKTAENIENKFISLKDTISSNNFMYSSFNKVFNDLKILESYVAELADIASAIHQIHPTNRNSDFEYESDYTDGYSNYYEEKESNPWKNSMFFSTCNTKEDLTKKYRELAKIYHPDNSVTGNAETFKKLKLEYEEYSKMI